MACTYGVLAGTLVGAATLAFEDRPSENLNKVARGASIGLYTGILMGLYVMYLVPSGNQIDGDLYPLQPLPSGVLRESREKQLREAGVNLKRASTPPVSTLAQSKLNELNPEQRNEAPRFSRTPTSANLERALKRAAATPVLFHPMVNLSGRIDGVGMQLRLASF